jgi:hypothetical protein
VIPGLFEECFGREASRGGWKRRIVQSRKCGETSSNW